jgi:hypothetical protein
MEIAEFVAWGKLLTRSDGINDSMTLDLWIQDLQDMPADDDRDTLLTYAIRKRRRALGRFVGEEDRRALVPLAQKWNSWGDASDAYFEFLQGDITEEDVSRHKAFVPFHQMLCEWCGTSEPHVLARALFRVMEAVQHHIPAGKKSGRTARAWTADTSIMTLW